MNSPLGTTLDELDAAALDILAEGRVDAAVPAPDELAGADFSGRPWAELVVASAFAHAHRVDEAETLLADAQAQFETAHDRRGRGWVAQVRATIALGRGEMSLLVEHLDDVRTLLDGDTHFPADTVARLGLVSYHNGHVGPAIRLAETALTLARSARNRRDEGVALAYLAYFEFWRGRLVRVERLLDAAEDTYAAMGEPTDAFELPVTLALRGNLHAVRGQFDAAEGQYTAALKVAADRGVPWYEAIILSQRAHFLGPFEPRRSRIDALASYERLVELGDEWWQVWSLRAQGIAETALGSHAAAERFLQVALDRSSGPQDRALTLIALGNDRLEMGDTEAAATLLRDGIECARQADVGLMVAWCASLLARAEPESADEWFRVVREHDDGDPAYEQLLTTGLRIGLLGEAGVWRRRNQLGFATRHAETALFALALADDHTIHEEVLAERLWPEAPADKIGGRLATLLWQVRRGLGPDGWRVRRHNGLIHLECRGLDIDVVTWRAAAARLLTAAEVNGPVVRETVAALSRPLLPGLQYEGWVQLAAHQLTAIVSGLETLLPL